MHHSLRSGQVTPNVTSSSLNLLARCCRGQNRDPVFCSWLTWEWWSGLVSLRTADSLTPSLPASSTLVMRWALISELRASLAATTAGTGTLRYQEPGLWLGTANWHGGFCHAPPRPQRGTSPRATLGGAPLYDSDFDLWSPAHGSERFLHLADVGAVAWVGQLAHGGVGDGEPAGEVYLGDALGPLCGVQGQVGGGAGRLAYWGWNEGRRGYRRRSLAEAGRNESGQRPR